MKKVDALYAIKQFGRISKELGYKLTREQIFELACLSKKKKLRLKGVINTMKQKTINDLNQYCENENIKIIERLIKENKELKLRIEDIEYDIQLIWNK